MTEVDEQHFKTMDQCHSVTKKVLGCEQSEEMKNEKNKRSYTEAYQTLTKTVAMDIR